MKLDFTSPFNSYWASEVLRQPTLNTDQFSLLPESSLCCYPSRSPIVICPSSNSRDRVVLGSFSYVITETLADFSGCNWSPEGAMPAATLHTQSYSSLRCKPDRATFSTNGRQGTGTVPNKLWLAKVQYQRARSLNWRGDRGQLESG